MAFEFLILNGKVYFIYFFNIYIFIKCRQKKDEPKKGRTKKRTINKSKKTKKHPKLIYNKVGGGRFWDWVRSKSSDKSAANPPKPLVAANPPKPLVAANPPKPLVAANNKKQTDYQAGFVSNKWIDFTVNLIPNATLVIYWSSRYNTTFENIDELTTPGKEKTGENKVLTKEKILSDGKGKLVSEGSKQDDFFYTQKISYIYTNNTNKNIIITSSAELIHVDIGTQYPINKTKVSFKLGDNSNVDLYINEPIPTLHISCTDSISVKLDNPKDLKGFINHEGNYSGMMG